MFQPATLGLCVSLLADLFPVGAGSRVDLATGARAELTAGRIPVTSVDDSEPGTEQILAFRSGVRLISPTSTFTLAYRPRYYLRLPDALQVGRPLLLHDATMDWTARPNRKLTLNWIGRTSAGEIPNSGLAFVFDPGTGSVTSRVVPVVQLDTSLSVSAATGKRHDTDGRVTARHYDSMGPDAAFESSDALGFSLSHTIALSSRTSIGISTQAAYVWPDVTPESATFGALLSLTQRTLASATWRLTAGYNQGWTKGGDFSWPLPTVTIGYGTAVNATGESWRIDFDAGTRAFFDVPAATYRPQLFVATSIAGQIHRSWTAAANLTFSTDISGQSDAPGDQPTQLNFDAPFGYRINRNLQLAFGLRLALRAPALSDWGTGKFQDQVSVFLALDWGVGTEASQGGWL
jgi:hypothetical protein